MADFYADAAKLQADQLAAEMSAAQADLQAYRRNGDHESAAATVQNIADIQAKQNNLATLWHQYTAAQRPQQQYVSRETRAARGPSEMDAQDLADVMNDSRYSKLGTGRGFTADDYYRLRSGLPYYKTSRGVE